MVIIRVGGGDYEFEGGDAIYTDVNNDGTIDQQDVVKIGNMNPDFFGGANSTVAYKAFSVSFNTLSSFLYNVMRDRCADKYPLLAANRNHFSAISSFFGALVPTIFMYPRAYWARESPCAAAFK